MSSQPVGVSTEVRNGWQIVILRSTDLEVAVLPGKGGDVLSAVRRRDGLNVLWRSPWGLRAREAVSGLGSDSVARLMAAYPGGWQTVFPNGGDATVQHGVEWGMHGEVWLTPFDWYVEGESTVVMSARLVLSPFQVTKCISVHDDAVTVDETITNEGGESVATMWSHHPAFGAPFLSGDCVLDTAATTVDVDAVRDTGSGDLARGSRGVWPYAPAADGSSVDLRDVPAEGSRIDRMAYLGGFARGWARVRNPMLDAGVELIWDVEVFPHAWYWLEANGSPGFPWYRGAYVLGIEPAAVVPGRGIGAVADCSALVDFSPGQTRMASIALQFTGGQ